MTIFSEIYGAYFRIVSKVLEKETTSISEIEHIIEKYGFEDSRCFVTKKIIPQKDGSDWGVLKGETELHRVIENPPVKVFTTLYKRWLKAKLADPKMRLFLDNKTMKELNNRLKDVKPLYKMSDFRYIDMFSDGDDFYETEYIEHFRTVLSAIKKKEILRIDFTSGSGNNINSYFAPLKLEYSQKNNKFRIYCFQIKNGRISGSGVINMGRINSVESTGEVLKGRISMNRYFGYRRCKTPVTVKITTERNAVERFLMEFSSYEKQTERKLDSDICTVKLWYDEQDKTELLIRLLSFGPVIEIVSPPEFRKLAGERIKKQYELLYNNK